MNISTFKHVKQVAGESVLKVLNLFVNDLHISEKIGEFFSQSPCVREKQLSIRARSSWHANTCGINSAFHLVLLSFILYSYRDTQGRADAGHGWRGERRA